MQLVERSADRLKFSVDSSLYPDEVVFKCFYWYGDTYDVTIQRSADGTALEVAIVPRSTPLTPEALRSLESRIQRDLIDFKTRQIVQEETKLVRELLIAKAFSHSDEFDSPPPGSLTHRDA